MQVDKIAQNQPAVAAVIRDEAIRNGTMPTERQLQADGAKAAQSGNAGVATLASAVQRGGAEGLKQVLAGGLRRKRPPTKSLISGSEESGYKTAKFAGVQALASGLVGEKELDKAKLDAAGVGSQKVAVVAVKGSGGLRADAADDAFDSDLPIASKLAQMRSAKDEAVPALAKTASMSA